MLRLFTDTDTDITKEGAGKYGYELISMPYSIDGNTVRPYEDFETFDAHAFYNQLRSGVLPNTSAISEENYVSYFEPVFAAGDDILYVHFSAAMTATFDVMHRALEKLKEKYPGRRFYEIDTLGITLMSYSIVCEIGQMYLDGKSAEEMVEWAKKGVYTWATYFFADDLKFFHHSGRVGGLAATMGTLLGVRPIIYMDSDGKMTSIGKERGRRKAMTALIDKMKEIGDEVQAHPVYVGHADAPGLVEEFTCLLRETFGNDLKIEIVDVNPTAGSHCGPDTLGVCFHSIRR